MLDTGHLYMPFTQGPSEHCIDPRTGGYILHRGVIPRGPGGSVWERLSAMFSGKPVDCQPCTHNASVRPAEKECPRPRRKSFVYSSNRKECHPNTPEGRLRLFDDDTEEGVFFSQKNFPAFRLKGQQLKYAHTLKDDTVRPVPSHGVALTF